LVLEPSSLGLDELLERRRRSGGGSEGKKEVELAAQRGKRRDKVIAFTL